MKIMTLLAAWFKAFLLLEKPQAQPRLSLGISAVWLPDKPKPITIFATGVN